MRGSERQALSRLQRRALDRLLTEYLEQAAGDRVAFLRRCHQRWPRLTRWLEELVSAERGITLTLLDKPLREVGDQAMERIEQCEDNRLESGYRLGPWRIIELAGEGGLGKVYRGERADGAFEKTVAIKLLRLRGAGLGEQLQRECRLLARLDHPAVSRLLDAGLDEQAGPFLVMDWIEGEDLSGWIGDKPSRECCLDVMMSLCEAVDHAHRQLIIHGDIKPGNVRLDSQGRVKLLDFGIARLIGATEDNPEAIGALTPSFAPPEQHRGAPLDARSDVWALGALLSWMLSGGRMHAPHEQSDRLPGPEVAIGDTELRAMIDKACDDDPRQRYASASDLLTDLEHYRQHRPLAAMPATAGYRVRKFIRRNPVLVGGIAATTTVLIAGLITTSVWYLEADQQARTLEQVVGFQERQLAGIEPALMGAVLRDSLNEESRQTLALLHDSEATVATRVRDLEDLLTAMNFSNIAVEALDETIFSTILLAIDEEFRGQPGIRARLIQTVATALRELGQIDSAATQQERALRLRTEYLGANHRETLHSMHENALLRKAQGDFEAAEESLRLALTGRREVLGPRHPDLLQTKHEMGRLMMSSERHDTALDYGYRVLEHQREVLGKDHPDTLRTLKFIGMTYRWLGRFEEAIEALQGSLQGHRRQLGDRHPETLSVVGALGLALARKGHMEEARMHFAEVLHSRRSVLGDHHPATVQSVCSKGVMLRNMDLIDQAKPFYLECVEGRERLFGSAHPDTLSAYNNMGVLLRLRGAYEESVQYLEKAVKGQLAVYGIHHRAPLITKLNLGRSLEEKGRLERALEVQNRAVSGFEETVSGDHWLLGAGLNGKGRILHRMGRFEDAEAVFLEVWEIFAHALGPEHHRTTELIAYMEDFHSDWAAQAPESKVMMSRSRWLAELENIATEDDR